MSFNEGDCLTFQDGDLELPDDDAAVVSIQKLIEKAQLETPEILDAQAVQFVNGQALLIHVDSSTSSLDLDEDSLAALLKAFLDRKDPNLMMRFSPKNGIQGAQICSINQLTDSISSPFKILFDLGDFVVAPRQKKDGFLLVPKHFFAKESLHVKSCPGWEGSIREGYGMICQRLSRKAFVRWYEEIMGGEVEDRRSWTRRRLSRLHSD